MKLEFPLLSYFSLSISSKHCWCLYPYSQELFGWLHPFASSDIEQYYAMHPEHSFETVYLELSPLSFCYASLSSASTHDASHVGQLS